MRAGKVLLCTILLQCSRGLFPTMIDTRLSRIHRSASMKPEFTRPSAERGMENPFPVPNSAEHKHKRQQNSSAMRGQRGSDAFVISAEKPEHENGFQLEIWKVPVYTCWCLHVFGTREHLWHLWACGLPWPCRERAVWHWACPAQALADAAWKTWNTKQRRAFPGLQSLLKNAPRLAWFCTQLSAG